VACAAANLRFFYILIGFLAVGIDLDLVREKRKGTLKFWSELHMLTGIRSKDSRDGTTIA